MIPVQREMFEHMTEMNFEASQMSDSVNLKCVLISKRCESDEMDESLINMKVNVKEKIGNLLNEH